MTKVAVLGLGYVGFPLACAIARNKDYEVYGFDLSKEKISTIQAGKSPVKDERAEKDIKEVKISVSDDPATIKGADFFMICVPTPIDSQNMPDFGPLKGAIETVAGQLEKGGTVIIESTVNPGVCDEIVIPLLEEKTGMKVVEDFNVAHCPERISPGMPHWNVYNITRNVGASSPEACKRVADFYRSFLEGEVYERSSLKVAEATKIVENTFRDINIAFVNELAKSFDIMGIDLIEVIKGAANKPFDFVPHFPSCGVGGHCIPVDPYYLIERARQSGFKHTFLSMAREINNSMPQYTVDLLMRGLNEVGLPLKGAKVGVLGLSYKPDIGDLRESPSVRIIKILKANGAEVETFDPYLSKESTAKSVAELLSGVEAVILATDHREFRDLSLDDFIKNDIKVLIDGKNMFNPVEFNSSQLIYKGIGRG